MPDPKGKKEENEVERLKWATRREASKPASLKRDTMRKHHARA